MDELSVLALLSNPCRYNRWNLYVESVTCRRVLFTFVDIRKSCEVEDIIGASSLKKLKAF